MSKNSLIIADLQSHALGGHFASWLNYTIREAAKHFDFVHIYVADDESRPKLPFLAGAGENVRVTLIPDVYQKKKYRGDILGILAEHHKMETGNPVGTPIFIMWAQQFLERDRIFPPYSSFRSWVPWSPRKCHFKSPWGTLTSVSSVAHGAEKIPIMESRVHDEIGGNAWCKGILLWDEYAVRKLGGKYLYLPDVEPLEVDDSWEMPESGPLTIGSVGQLWGYRSMNLLAEILGQELSLRGYVSGMLKPDSYSEQTRKFIQSRDKLICDEGFIPDDEELGVRLRKMDAFLIDSRTYKCPSGLGIRALGLGRPIVSMESPSWIASLIQENGVGVFWKPGEEDLSQKLREWYASGGVRRSVETAQRLSDMSQLEQAYAGLFERLKQSVE